MTPLLELINDAILTPLHPEFFNNNYHVSFISKKVNVEEANKRVEYICSNEEIINQFKDTVLLYIMIYTTSAKEDIAHLATKHAIIQLTT